MTRRAAIVTGVSRGLGEALAADLLGRGFEVTGVGRASSPRLAGPRYRFVACDLAAQATIDTAVAPALRALAAQRPDAVCLINNAATAEPVGVLGNLPHDALVASLAVNLLAPLLLADLFCRGFTDPGVSRRIVNVSSGLAERPLPGGSPYSIAKAGLEMLTRQLAVENPAPGIEAVTIRPGIIDTGMQLFMRSQPVEVMPSVDLFRDFHDSGQLLSPDVVAAKIVERLVLGPIERGRTYSFRDL
jgi:NAD(P)-dependent dehydrogenase (short-subunit alcohol dehydrogenase family)